MNFFRKKSRTIRDKTTSSDKWRNIVYNQLKNCVELNPFIDEDVLYIFQLIVTHDTVDNRKKMEDYLAVDNIKRLKKLQGKFPIDFDEVDYPVLELISIEKNQQTYVVILAQDVNLCQREVIKIISGHKLSKDDFETRELIYPLE